MAFASLQEAWGVPTLGPALDDARPAAAAPLSSAPEPPPSARAAATRSRAAAPRRRAVPTDPDVAVARRALDRAYRRAGTEGVLALLPRCVAKALRRRRRERGAWAWLAGALADPDTVLFLLVLAFLALVIWDGCSGGASAPADLAPTLTSLHMSPFPLGTSAAA